MTWDDAAWLAIAAALFIGAATDFRWFRKNIYHQNKPNKEDETERKKEADRAFEDFNTLIEEALRGERTRLN